MAPTSLPDALVISAPPLHRISMVTHLLLLAVPVGVAARAPGSTVPMCLVTGFLSLLLAIGIEPVLWVRFTTEGVEFRRWRGCLGIGWGDLGGITIPFEAPNGAVLTFHVRRGTREWRYAIGVSPGSLGGMSSADVLAQIASRASSAVVMETRPASWQLVARACTWVLVPCTLGAAVALASGPASIASMGWVATVALVVVGITLLRGRGPSLDIRAGMPPPEAVPKTYRPWVRALVGR